MQGEIYSAVDTYFNEITKNNFKAVNVRIIELNSKYFLITLSLSSFPLISLFLSQIRF